MPLTIEEILQRIAALAMPLLKEAGVELVELKVGQHNQDVQVQFFADLPQGGITMQQCAELNHAIALAIDTEGFLADAYTLEFSSPGLDRPLTTEKDFLRNANRPVQVFLSAPLDGKKEWVGIITGVTADAVTMLTKQKKQMTVPLARIIKAVLVI